MCAISLQYDQHNTAAVKMLEAIIAAGLFTVTPDTMAPMSIEDLNHEMDRAESDIRLGRVLSADSMSERMNQFVQKFA